MSEPMFTYYSQLVMGNERNYNGAARFDYTDGFVGLSQGRERVLLTPHQMRELEAFIAQCKQSDYEYVKEAGVRDAAARKRRRA